MASQTRADLPVWSPGETRHPHDVPIEWLTATPISEVDWEVLVSLGIREAQLRRVGLIQKGPVAFSDNGSFEPDSEGDPAYWIACSRSDVPYANILAFEITEPFRFGFLEGVEPILGNTYIWGLFSNPVRFFKNPIEWMKGDCEGCVVVQPGKAGPLLRSLSKISVAANNRDLAQWIDTLRSTPPGYHPAEYYEVAG